MLAVARDPHHVEGLSEHIERKASLGKLQTARQ
jgi:hypothetical protein